MLFRQFAVFAAILVLSGMVFTSGAAAQQEAASGGLIIVVVDKTAAINNSKVATNIRNQMESRRQALQAEVDKTKGVIAAEEKALKEKVATMDAATRQAESRKFQEKVVATNRQIRERLLAVDRAVGQARKTVELTINQIVAEMVKQYGFSLVIRKETTMHVAANLDITPHVQAALDQRLQTIDVFGAKP